MIGSKRNWPHIFSHLLNSYQKFISHCLQGDGDRGENLGVHVIAVVLEPEDLLVVLDVTYLSKQLFMLVAVYVLKECRQARFSGT